MLDEQITRGLIRTALQEDLRYGPDVTSLATVGPAQRSRATVTSRVDGVIAAPFLVVVLLIARDPKIMGRHRNGRLSATLGWLTAALMTGAAILAVAG